jgi:hypothetical protein
MGNRPCSTDLEKFYLKLFGDSSIGSLASPCPDRIDNDTHRHANQLTNVNRGKIL